MPKRGRQSGERLPSERSSKKKEVVESKFEPWSQISYNKNNYWVAEIGPDYVRLFNFDRNNKKQFQNVPIDELNAKGSEILIAENLYQIGGKKSRKRSKRRRRKTKKLYKL